MKKKDTTREKIKNLYLNGTDINDICVSLGITRTNFYYHKNADLKKGCDWDALALNAVRDSSSIKEREANFLKTLISSFEKFIGKSDELDERVLEKLHQYAQTYWRLKAPTKNDEFSLNARFQQIARDTIEGIAQIALAQNNKAVVEFLAQNADEIIKTALKAKK